MANEMFSEEKVSPTFQKLRWCFTSFKDEPPLFSDDMKYLLFAPEVCPTTQRKHWQGYVEWKNKKTTGGASKALGGCSVFPAKAEVAMQQSYICGPYEKDGKSKPVNPDAQQFGQPANPDGVRYDFTSACKDILLGKRKADDVAETEPLLWHTYGRTLEKQEQIRQLRYKRHGDCKIYWNHKQRANGFHHNKTQHAWDNYDGETTLIIDNLLPGELEYKTIHNLLYMENPVGSRRYKHDIPICVNHIYIYSKYMPWQIWPNYSNLMHIGELLAKTTIDGLTNQQIKDAVLNYSDDSTFRDDRDYQSMLLDKFVS